MIVKTVLGNLSSGEFNDFKIIQIPLENDDRLKQILRLKAEDETEFGISLENGAHLHDGDVLAQENGCVWAIKCQPIKVLAISANSIGQMAFVAHSIGNRHTPAQFENDEMIIEYDYLIEDWLKEHNVPFECQMRVLKHALKHAHHHH